MAGNHPSNDTFDRLPEELLLQIIKLSPDLQCLWNLVQASPALSGVLGRSPLEILEAVLHRSVYERILPVMRAVLRSRISCFPLSLDASRRIVAHGPSPTPPSEGGFPGGAEAAAEGVRWFLATADNIHAWSHVCLDRLIRRSLELRPLTLVGYPDRLYLPQVFGQAEAAPEPHTPLPTGPPSPTEEWRVLRAFWLLQFFLELRAASAGGRLDRWWPRQDRDVLATSSVGDFFELHGSSQQQLFTVHDFLSVNSAATDASIIPCVEKPPFVVAEDRPHGLNRAWVFHHYMTTGCVPYPLLGPFEPYRKFGFAIWDDQRMVDLGFMGSRRNPFAIGSFYCFRWRSIVTEAELS